jgi:hypothetical protein
VRLGLLQHAYWEGGFERPLFLAYGDGTILFARSYQRWIPTAYGMVRFSTSELDSALSALGLNSSVERLDSLYDYAPGVTDQHSFYLLIPGDTGTRVIRVRAGWQDTVHLRADVPAPFRRLYYAMRDFAPPQATDWSPDSIEVQIWPYEYAPDNPPLEWPSRLPTLTDSRWNRRADRFVEEVWMLRLPSADEPTIDSLLGARRPKQAVGLGDRKWAMGARWVFPNEGSWWWLSKHLEY